MKAYPFLRNGFVVVCPAVRVAAEQVTLISVSKVRLLAAAIL